MFLAGHVTATAGAITSLARPRTPLASRVDDFGQFLDLPGRAGGHRARLLLGLHPAGWTRGARGCGAGPTARSRLGLLGMVVTGAAQADLTGGGLGALAHWSIDTQAFGGKFGAAVRGTAGRTGALPRLAASTRTTIARQFAAFYGLLVAAGAFVLFGHAIVSPERWLSIPADIVHVVFVAMWAGGLFGLVTVLRRRVRAARRVDGQEERPRRGPAPRERAPPADAGGRPRLAGRGGDRDRGARAHRPLPASVLAGTSAPATRSERARCWPTPSRVVGRFSTMAGISFAGILVAGTLLAVAEVGSVANLFDTGYGQLLLVKIATGRPPARSLPATTATSSCPGLLSAAASDRQTGDRARVEAARSQPCASKRIGMVAVLGVTARPGRTGPRATAPHLRPPFRSTRPSPSTAAA